MPLAYASDLSICLATLGSLRGLCGVEECRTTLWQDGVALSLLPLLASNDTGDDRPSEQGDWQGFTGPAGAVLPLVVTCLKCLCGVPIYKCRVEYWQEEHVLHSRLEQLECTAEDDFKPVVLPSILGTQRCKQAHMLAPHAVQAQTTQKEVLQQVLDTLLDLSVTSRKDRTRVTNAQDDSKSIKEQANAAFKKKDFKHAVSLYQKALQVLPRHAATDPDRRVLHSNLSEAFLKLCPGANQDVAHSYAWKALECSIRALSITEPNQATTKARTKAMKRKLRALHLLLTKHCEDELPWTTQCFDFLQGDPLPRCLTTVPPTGCMTGGKDEARAFTFAGSALCKDSANSCDWLHSTRYLSRSELPARVLPSDTQKSAAQKRCLKSALMWDPRHVWLQVVAADFATVWTTVAAPLDVPDDYISVDICQSQVNAAQCSCLHLWPTLC